MEAKSNWGLTREFAELAARIEVLEAAKTIALKDIPALAARLDALEKWRDQAYRWRKERFASIDARLDAVETFADNTAALLKRRTARHDALAERGNIHAELLASLNMSLSLITERVAKLEVVVASSEFLNDTAELEERVLALERSTPRWSAAGSGARATGCRLAMRMTLT